MMDFIECTSCGFVETDEDTFLEDSVTYENEDGEEYDVFCLKCPKCGSLTNFEY